jgi:hypothetical protein
LTSSISFSFSSLPHISYDWYLQLIKTGLDSSIDPSCSFPVGNVAGAQVATGGGDCYYLGVLDQGSGTYDSNSKKLTLTFQGGQDSRQVEVDITCDTSQPTPNIPNPASEPVPLTYEYDATWSNSDLCGGAPSPGPTPTPPPTPSPGPGPSPGPSPTPAPTKPKHKPKKTQVGWILVGVFLGSLTIYFVAGFVFLKYQRGAEGKEAIPNVEFWASLWPLFREGVSFTWSKITRREGSYQSL